MDHDHTQGAGFRTTRWSLVIEAAADPAALGQLLEQYWSPMYAYLRRSGLSRDDAAELVQEFMTERVMGGALLQRADPERGRFRTFVKASLKNFLIDHHRRARAHRRAPSGAGVVRLSSLDAIEPRDTDDPGRAFDRQWAATLMANVLRSVEQSCQGDGRRSYWRVFERVVILPALHKTAPPPLAEVAREFEIDSPERVSAMIQTVRRRFRRTLADAIADTVADQALVNDEADELRDVLRL